MKTSLTSSSLGLFYIQVTNLFTDFNNSIFKFPTFASMTLKFLFATVYPKLSKINKLNCIIHIFVTMRSHSNLINKDWRHGEHKLYDGHT